MIRIDDLRFVEGDSKLRTRNSVEFDAVILNKNIEQRLGHAIAHGQSEPHGKTRYGSAPGCEQEELGRTLCATNRARSP